MRQRKTLLVGAYERDNFGDILFLLVTERFFGNAGVDTLAGAPFPSDMTSVFGRNVVSAGRELRRRRVSCVWTVGGEVGPISPLGALSMAHSSDHIVRIREMASESRGGALFRYLGGPGMGHPYMPDVTRFWLNRNTPYVLNSAGLSGLATRDEEFQASAQAILRRAAGVSVRDPASSGYLEKNGIPHAFMPDLIHVIALDPAGERSTERGPVVFQAARKLIGRMGVEPLAEAIASSSAVEEYGLRFMTAGTAPGHDSIESYRVLADAIRAIKPNFRIEFSHTIDPWERVEELRSSRAVIASSLHCRIVACAADVPRVSLASGKTTRYARHWDAAMPSNARPQTLARDLERAMSKAAVEKAAGTGQRLAQLAHDNMQSMMVAAGVA